MAKPLKTGFILIYLFYTSVKKSHKHFCTFFFSTLKESLDNNLPVSIWEVWLNLDSSTGKFSQHFRKLTNMAQYTIMLWRLQHLSWLLVGLVGLICFVLSPDFCVWKLSISFSINSSNSNYCTAFPPSLSWLKPFECRHEMSPALCWWEHQTHQF